MEINQIICGDNVDVLATFPDECIDLTVTSPPYDNLRKYNGYIWDFEALVRELFRVTKLGGAVVWVVGDSVIDGSESGSSFKQALCFMESSFRLHDTMIYEKAGAAFPEKVRYYQIFEYMFVFSRGKPKTINLIKDKPNKWAGQYSFGESSNRQKNGTIKKGKRRKTNDVGVRNNIWRYANGKGFGQSDNVAYSHPATFPEKLAQDHIISWSNAGDLVLDPFVGSGTTPKMAKLLGRNYIGIDISKEYCELSEKRISSIRSLL